MDKLIVNERGEAQITNDGATILKLLDIVHPAARTLVDIARAQDAEVGDGTTSVVLLAAQLLKEVRGYIEEGVSPHIIMKGFRQAAQLVCAHFPSDRTFDWLMSMVQAVERVEEIQVKVDKSDSEFVFIPLVQTPNSDATQEVPCPSHQMRLDIDVVKTYPQRKTLLL